MRKFYSLVMGLSMIGMISNSFAQSEIKVSGDLELFYEYSKNLSTNDDDQFKTNQLYVTFDGVWEEGLQARLKLDGADLKDGKSVSEKVVEEANFTFKEINGSPVTLVFGKDEMPFGQDYDKYINDSLVHNFEIDKVWGINGNIKITDFGKIELGAYQHRNGSDENQLYDNLCVRLKVDNLIKNVSFQISAGSEEYMSIPAVSATATTAGKAEVVKDDEVRLGAGFIIKFGNQGNFNFEYVTFQNQKGKPDYDPGLVTIGAQYGIAEKTKIFGRYEKILTDDEPASGLEEDFFLMGINYQLGKKYTLALEYTNYNSSDLSDAKDLNVSKNSIEDSIKFGCRAKF